MSITEDVKLQVLNDHYNQTCDDVRASIKRRDWIMIFVIFFLAIQFFQISNPEKASDAVISFVKKSYEIELVINRLIFEALLWFVLLASLIRYYQINVFINRQYKYVHHIEAQFAKLIGKDVIAREGVSYLKKYPLFLDWLHVFYAWIYPGSLIIAATYNIFCSWNGVCSLLSIYGISVAFYLMIVISTVLYLIFLHENRKSYDQKK